LYRIWQCQPKPLTHENKHFVNRTHYQRDGFVHVGTPQDHGFAHQTLRRHAREARLLRQHPKQHLARRARVLVYRKENVNDERIHDTVEDHAQYGSEVKENEQKSDNQK